MPPEKCAQYKEHEYQVASCNSLTFLHQMILKSLVRGDYHLSPGDPERHKEPENMTSEFEIKLPDDIVDDLNSAEDGEASEESHCSSNETQLSLQSHLCNFIMFCLKSL